MANTLGFPPTRARYIAQLEHDQLHSNNVCVCQACLALGFDKTLRRCTGCRLIDYCSKECQKAHWKKHRGLCNMAQGKGAKNAFLTSYLEDAAYQVLIDSYRVRTTADHKRGDNHGIYYESNYYEGNYSEDSVWARGDAIDDFQRYLDLAEDADVLPRWWHFEERMKCLSKAVSVDIETNIFHAVDREKLILEYKGETAIYAALSILAEIIVGPDGKGPVTDNTSFQNYLQYLEMHPEVQTELIKDTMDTVKSLLEKAGREVPTNVSAEFSIESDHPT